MNDREMIEALRSRVSELEERNRQLEDALCPPADCPPLEWGLTSTEAKVFAHLASRDMVTKRSVMAALYSDRPEEPEPKITDVFICKLRRKLKPFGVSIVTVWGQGWSLERMGAA